jgi:hypothetical protein
MEVGFDKEIDALMRSSGGGRTITISEFAAPHLDADTLTAFAENALPDAARRGYMTHLADCDGCRKTFAELISMNAEAEPVSAVSAIPALIAETSVPWYKSLFAVQNLAYGMGALVIAFAGFIGYTVLQNTGMSGDSSATVSQVSDQRPASGPMVSDSENFAANTTANAANSSAPANTNGAVSANKLAQPADLANGGAANTIVGEDVAISSEKPALVLDGVDAAKPAAAAPPPPAAAAPVTRPEPKELMSEADKSKDDSRPADMKVMRQEEQMPSAGNMPNTQAGPSRNVQRDNRSSDERELAKKRSIPGFGRTASPSKTVSGKNFSKRDNVWYDSSYSGQATTNVRRGTEDYRKLDRGLRTIAESLDGVVVVVWKSKAYRIQ